MFESLHSYSNEDAIAENISGAPPFKYYYTKGQFMSHTRKKLILNKKQYN